MVRHCFLPGPSLSCDCFKDTSQCLKVHHHYVSVSQLVALEASMLRFSDTAAPSEPSEAAAEPSEATAAAAIEVADSQMAEEAALQDPVPEASMDDAVADGEEAEEECPATEDAPVED